MFRSEDLGASWINCSAGLPSYYYFWPVQLLISPDDPDSVIFCFDYLYRWNDRGDLWEPFGFQATDVAYAPSDPNLLYVCSDEYSYLSENGGESWKIAKDACGGVSVAVSYTDPNLVILSDGVNGLWRSTDRLNNVEFRSSGLMGEQILHLFCCDTRGDILLCAGVDSIQRSGDGGDSWAPCTPWTDIYSPLMICQSPSNPRTIYTTDSEYYGFIYRSDDSAISWSMTGQMPYYYMTPIVVDPTDSSRLYSAYASA